VDVRFEDSNRILDRFFRVVFVAGSDGSPRVPVNNVPGAGGGQSVDWRLVRSLALG
jgi:hypothetical protein